MNSAKCLVADERNTFCVLGRLYELDVLGESLRFLRLCRCTPCAKAQHYRQHLTKIAAITFRQEETR